MNSFVSTDKTEGMLDALRHPRFVGGSGMLDGAAKSSCT